MKKILMLSIMTMFASSIFSCAAPPDRYNTQSGAAIGAGLGAITGQMIGHNARSTLLGAGVGALVGAIAGNSADQTYQAEREYRQPGYARTGYGYSAPAYPAYYYRSYRAVPAYQPTRCRKILKRTYVGDSLVRERVEEICESDCHTEY